MLFAVDISLTYLSMLPALVFLAETCVVTLSTVRTICIGRGRKVWAALLGFFEVSIWLFAIGQIMQNLSDLGCYIAFASGFSLGNFLGIVIEKKLALGDVVVQITTKKSTRDLIEGLKAAGYGVTKLDAHGATGPVQVVFTVVKRKELDQVVLIIRGFDSKAFYSVNDLQLAEKGVFPPRRRRLRNAGPAPVVQMGRLAATVDCHDSGTVTEALEECGDGRQEPIFAIAGQTYRGA